MTHISFHLTNQRNWPIDLADQLTVDQLTFGTNRQSVVLHVPERQGKKIGIRTHDLWQHVVRSTIVLQPLRKYLVGTNVMLPNQLTVTLYDKIM